MPNAKYFPNESFEFNAVFIPQYNININSDDTISTPAIPNSSLIIENIKSVCGMIGHCIISGEYFEKDFMFRGQQHVRLHPE